MDPNILGPMQALPMTGKLGMLGHMNPMLLLVLGSLSGIVLGWGKNFWNTIKDHAVRPIMSRISVSLELDKEVQQTVYYLINHWAETELAKKKINAYVIGPPHDRIAKSRESMVDEEGFSIEENEAPINGYEQVGLYPAYGKYILRWKGYFLSFSHGVVDSKVHAQSKTSALNIVMYGTRDKKKLEELINDIIKTHTDNYIYTPKFFTYRSGFWKSSALSARGLDTIYLNQQLKDEIVGDIDKYLTNKKAYQRLGIVHKRGYLFYGDPGTGKSSLVRALSCHFKLPVYYLSLSNMHSSEDLTNALRLASVNSIILMEDVDCIAITNSRRRRFTEKHLLRTMFPDEEISEETTDGKPPQIIPLSELLNSLDGIISVEDRIVIMTTNHIDKLDPALIRSGRVDRKFEIPHPTELEIKGFYNEASKYYKLPEFNDLVSQLSGNFTIADLQAHITGNFDFVDQPKERITNED
jgi:hypothetical protein